MGMPKLNIIMKAKQKKVCNCHFMCFLIMAAQNAPMAAQNALEESAGYSYGSR